jgi:hypothetical protein
MSGPRGSGIEWLDVGPPDPDGRGRRRLRLSRRSVIVAAAALVVVGTIIAIAAVQHDGKRHAPAAARTSTAPSNISSATGPNEPATGTAGSASPRQLVLGHSLLGVTDGWDLFVRSTTSVARVQMASGHVTITPVPSLESGGGVGFIVNRDRAIIEPYDFVQGYVVRDGRPAQALTGQLFTGGYVYPGPLDGQLWKQLESSDPTSALELLDVTGRDLRTTVKAPTTMIGALIPDGEGYLISFGIGGSYDVRPGSLRRITPGAVTAIGPTKWLAEECDDHGVCSNVVIDHASGQRTVLGPTRQGASVSLGSISPDGTHAAMSRLSSGRQIAIDLMDLSTGTERTVTNLADDVLTESVLAWSPDSRWLFVVGASRTGGPLQVIDVHTLQHVPLGIQLPPAIQVAVRPAP